jgi:hypothetical protein
LISESAAAGITFERIKQVVSVSRNNFFITALPEHPVEFQDYKG